MAHGDLHRVLHHLRRLTAAGPLGHLSDRQLLERFLAERDEAAMAALVRRHGPMVLGVCRRALRHSHDAEDACQAAFLVLARKAASIRKRESLASWLHGVAYRVAMNLRRQLDRRRGREATLTDLPQADPAEATWAEVRVILDAELQRLPERYQAPLVLCYLEGKTRDEAARQLGWSLGTFRGRLERGRQLLRARLTRRGLTLAAVLAAGTLASPTAPAALPATLELSTMNAASQAVAGQAAAAAAVSARAAALAEGVMQAMLMTKYKIATAVLLAVATLGAGLVLVGPTALVADQPAAKDDGAKAGPAPTVYALLQVSQNEPRLLAGQPDPQAWNYNTFRRTQPVLIKSRLILNAALGEPKVAGLTVVRREVDPVAWLEKNLRADYPDEGEILRVGLSGPHPGELATIVNAVVGAYLKEVIDHEHELRRARLESLKKLHSEYDDLLRNKRRSLKEMAADVGSKSGEVLAVRQQFALAQLNKVQNELIDLQSELRREELAIAAQKEGAGTVKEPAISDEEVDEAADKDRQARAYQAEIEGLQSTLERIKQISLNPEKTPTYKASLEALEAARKGLASRREQLRELLGQLRERRRVSVESREQKIKQLRKQEEILAKEVERRMLEVNEVKKVTVDLEWLKDEIAQVEDVQKRVGTQLQALQVEIGAPPRIRLLQQAEAPRSK